MKLKQLLLVAIFLYIASTAISYAGFRAMSPTQQTADQLADGGTTDEEEELATDDILDIDPNAPRDQVCPLSGAKFTKTESDVWETRRPLAVMIENSPDARPQSGLIRADVVFEAVAEGGVTRFMAMYYCDAIRSDVVLAPVRSARTYYIDWASGFNFPLYVHVGGANLPGDTDALGQLGDYGWVGENDINQFSVGYPTFKRDYNRVPGKEIATEHTMVSTTELLWEVGVDREWTNTDPEGEEWSDGYEGWTFAEDLGEAGDETEISYNFWDREGGNDPYAVRWEFDPSTQTYKRFMGGTPHNDLESEKQISVSNVVVLYSRSKVVNELKHLLYQTTGTGLADIYYNGQKIEANWSKPKRTSELEFTDKKGKPIEFAPGKIWISVVEP